MCKGSSVLSIGKPRGGQGRGFSTIPSLAASPWPGRSWAARDFREGKKGKGKKKRVCHCDSLHTSAVQTTPQ